MGGCASGPDSMGALAPSVAPRERALRDEFDDDVDNADEPADMSSFHEVPGKLLDKSRWKIIVSRKVA